MVFPHLYDAIARTGSSENTKYGDKSKRNSNHSTYTTSHDVTVITYNSYKITQIKGPFSTALAHVRWALTRNAYNTLFFENLQISQNLTLTLGHMSIKNMLCREVVAVEQQWWVTTIL